MKRYVEICLGLLMCLAIPAAFAAPAPITLYTTASEPFAAYVAGPKNASKGIVLVHDWFGVTPFYTDAAQRLSKDGYRVVAVDLYGGRHAATHEEAGKLLESVHDDLAAREIDAALHWLDEGGRKTAVMGFSMGAKHALAAAMRNHSVEATVLWYGETNNDPQQLKQLGGPVLSIVGSLDGPAAAENSAAFSKAADAAGVGSEVFIYPGAEHAFAQPLFNQGKTYDPAGAQIAWLLSESFLQRRMH